MREIAVTLDVFSPQPSIVVCGVGSLASRKQNCATVTDHVTIYLCSSFIIFFQAPLLCPSLVDLTTNDRLISPQLRSWCFRLKHVFPGIMEGKPEQAREEKLGD